MRRIKQILLVNDGRGPLEEVRALYQAMGYKDIVDMSRDQVMLVNSELLIFDVAVVHISPFRRDPDWRWKEVVERLERSECFLNTPARIIGFYRGNIFPNLQNALTFFWFPCIFIGEHDSVEHSVGMLPIMALPD